MFFKEHLRCAVPQRLRVLLAWYTVSGAALPSRSPARCAPSEVSLVTLAWPTMIMLMVAGLLWQCTRTDSYAQLPTTGQHSSENRAPSCSGRRRRGSRTARTTPTAAAAAGGRTRARRPACGRSSGRCALYVPILIPKPHSLSRRPACGRNSGRCTLCIPCVFCACCLTRCMGLLACRLPSWNMCGSCWLCTGPLVISNRGECCKSCAVCGHSGSKCGAGGAGSEFL